VSLPEYSVELMLKKLVQSKLLRAIGKNQDAYLPVRPASRVAVLEVLQAGGPSQAIQGRYDEPLASALLQVESKSLAAVEGLSLANLMEQAKS
jgi:DNA-binding IscR family transcriptional regulator